jgi:hypothetical protein
LKTSGFVLSRLVDFECVTEPLVRAPGIDELQSAQRVAAPESQEICLGSVACDSRNVLERVTEGMRKVISGVDLCERHINQR